MKQTQGKARQGKGQGKAGGYQSRTQPQPTPTGTASGTGRGHASGARVPRPARRGRRGPVRGVWRGAVWLAGGPGRAGRRPDCLSAALLVELGCPQAFSEAAK